LTAFQVLARDAAVRGLCPRAVGARPALSARARATDGGLASGAAGGRATATAAGAIASVARERPLAAAGEYQENQSGYTPSP